MTCKLIKYLWLFNVAADGEEDADDDGDGR